MRINLQSYCLEESKYSYNPPRGKELLKYIADTSIFDENIDNIREKITQWMNRSEVINSFDIEQMCDVTTLLEEDILKRIIFVHDFSYRKCIILLKHNGYKARYLGNVISITELANIAKGQDIDIFLMSERYSEWC